jgi:FAD/FMN-containing dehydrogenase
VRAKTRLPTSEHEDLFWARARRWQQLWRRYLVTEVSWPDAAQSDDAIAWGREFWQAMGKYSTGGLYLNFPGFAEEKEALVRAGYGGNYDRLAELKAKYDPTNLFRMNLNITPAG